MMRSKFVIFFMNFAIISAFVVNDEKRSESEMIKYIQALEEFSPKSQQETIQKYGEEEKHEKEDNKNEDENENKMMKILNRINNWLDFLEETLKSDGFNAIIENFLEGDLQGRFKRSPYRGWRKRNRSDDEEADDGLGDETGEGDDDETSTKMRRRSRRGRSNGRRNQF